ncbi:MAG: geranylgeranyl reductase family protein [Aquificaceae bacterium]
MKKFDVVIIGGGPGGSSCAYKLSSCGAHVLVVDFKRSIGTPVQCAEYVPVQLYNQFGEFFLKEAIAQKVFNMVNFTPWEQTVSMPSEGFVLNRNIFDHHIARLADKKGTIYAMRTRFLGLEDGKVWLENIENRERFYVRSDFLVGADGPHSKVAKLTGEHTKSFLKTAQVTLPLRKPLHDLLIYFKEYIPGGYGWIFPKGYVANVGVGIDADYPVNIMGSLSKFLEEVTKEGIVENKVVSKTGGWIPADGLLKPVRDNVLLVGDAGGFCHPITGGGIANAVLSGSMAGVAILSGRVKDYEEEAQDVFGNVLLRASMKRKRYMKRWDHLERTIPITWIAFEEYWR